MSGPKSSRYTLTAAQRRALAEQLEKERQLRIQKEKEKRLRIENLELCSGIENLINRNRQMIESARALENESGFRIQSIESAEKQTGDIDLLQTKIRAQTNTSKGDALERQGIALRNARSKLDDVYSSLKKDYGDTQEAHKAKLNSAITQASNLSFDIKASTGNDYLPEEEVKDTAAYDAKQKCLDALNSIELATLPDSLKVEYNAISEKLDEIQTGNYFKNYHALTVVPFIEKCNEWNKLVEGIGEKYNAAKDEYQILCDELGETAKVFEFSQDGLTALSSEVERLKAIKLDDEEQAYISQTLDDVMSEMGYKLVGNNEVTKRNGKHFKKELYLFEEGTAVNVTTSDSGQITMELGLLDTQDRIPDVEETDTLCRQMRTFCGNFAEIEKKLAAKGIVSKHLSLLPPDAQFAQVINVEDYNMNDDATYVVKSKKESASEQKKMYY